MPAFKKNSIYRESIASRALKGFPVSASNSSFVSCCALRGSTAFAITANSVKLS